MVICRERNRVQLHQLRDHRGGHWSGSFSPCRGHRGPGSWHRAGPSGRYSAARIRSRRMSPQTPEEACDPQRLASLVYDMQIGVLRQIQHR
jgi:hypothetical protein